jgi:hypothetical protein
LKISFRNFFDRLALPQLGAGEAPRSESGLKPGDGDGFMGLDVRPKDKESLSRFIKGKKCFAA